jgi:MFS family permease
VRAAGFTTSGLPCRTPRLVFMGFTLVTAVLVVSLGRRGDIYGRVRMYNLGFAVFTLFSILLSDRGADPATGNN